jgi:Flp pilus assembly protein TadG
VRERGAGLFSTAFGFTVFLIFLLFTVQVLFGLYARTTVTAVASDLAQRAANEGPDLTPARFDDHVAEARRRLGRYGDDAEFRFALVDVDADGTDDTVAVTVDAALPILLPVRWSGYSPTEFSRTMRARLEVFQETAT